MPWWILTNTWLSVQPFWATASCIYALGTQTKANTLDDKGIQRMRHYGFSERAERQSKFKGLDGERPNNTFHCRGWKSCRNDLLPLLSLTLLSYCLPLTLLSPHGQFRWKCKHLRQYICSPHPMWKGMLIKLGAALTHPGLSPHLFCKEEEEEEEEETWPGSCHLQCALDHISTVLIIQKKKKKKKAPCHVEREPWHYNGPIESKDWWRSSCTDMWRTKYKTFHWFHWKSTSILKQKKTPPKTKHRLAGKLLSRAACFSVRQS